MCKWDTVAEEVVLGPWSLVDMGLETIADLKLRRIPWSCQGFCMQKIVCQLKSVGEHRHPVLCPVCDIDFWEDVLACLFCCFFLFGKEWVTCCLTVSQTKQALRKKSGFFAVLACLTHNLGIRDGWRWNNCLALSPTLAPLSSVLPGVNDENSA